jgi:ABC-type bacteriocin/lantibiotic exporter with double-glycine peptidase domain
MEVVGIGLIIPIVTIVFENKFSDNILFNNLLFFFNINVSENFDSKKIFLIVIFIFFLLKFVYVGYVLYIQSIFLKKVQVCLGKNIYNYYINLSLINFYKKKSSELIRDLTTEIINFITLLRCMFGMITEILILILILIFLLYINFKVSIFIFIFFCIFFYFFRSLNKNKFKYFSSQKSNLENVIIKNLQSVYGLFKEIKILKKTFYFYNEYLKNLKAFSKIYNNQYFVLQYPKLLLEFLSAIILIGTLSYLVFSAIDLKNLIILISIYIFAAFRSIPSISRITNYYTEFKFHSSAINIINKESIKNDYSSNLFDNDNIINFRKISLSNLHFGYNKKNKILKNVTLSIKKGDKVCIIGQSGSGKTTFVNLILGLLKPTSGSIFVDKFNLNKISYKWQKIIGYVPQNVFLLDDTIKKNIAFAIDNKEFNKSIFDSVIKKTQLNKLIKNLKDKENTNVGEIGNKLSGGQLQRIGIARALYFNPSVLILDESTNSLDVNTEKKIIKSLFAFTKNMTIFFITHRNHNIKYFNKIIRINNGNVFVTSR